MVLWSWWNGRSGIKQAERSFTCLRCKVDIKSKAVSVRLFLTYGREKTKVFWCFVKYGWLTLRNVGVLTSPDCLEVLYRCKVLQHLPLRPSQWPSSTFQLFRFVPISVRAKASYLDFSVLAAYDSLLQFLQASVSLRTNTFCPVVGTLVDQGVEGRTSTSCVRKKPALTVYCPAVDSCAWLL